MTTRKRAMQLLVFHAKYKIQPFVGNVGGWSQVENGQLVNYDIRAFCDITAEDPHNVWSVVEGDNGRDWYIVPGYHTVNMIGYYQTVNPWTEEDEQNGLTVKF